MVDFIKFIVKSRSCSWDISSYYYPYTYITAFVLGLLYIMGFAPIHIFPLTFVSLILVSLLFFNAQGYKHLIGLSLLYSAGITVGGLHWIIYAIQYVVNNVFLSMLLFLGFTFLYSIFIFSASIFIYLFKKYYPNKLQYFPVVATFSWFFSELVKATFLGGFPWFMPALLMEFNIYLLQTVSFIGSFWFSFWVLTLIFSFYILWDKQYKKRFLISLSLLQLLLFISGSIYGYIRLQERTLERSNAQDKTLIRIVGNNTSQEDKLNVRLSMPIAIRSIERGFSGLSEDYAPKYIIFSETALPLALNLHPELQEEIIRKTPTGSTSVVGALRYEDNKFYNSAYVFSGSEKSLVGVYDKVHLVPFGEYIPLQEHFDFISNFIGIGNLTAGDKITKFTENNTKFSVLICFEGLIPSVIKRTNNSSIIINISNEAWFNDSFALWQNVSTLRLNSIEFNTNIVKSTNKGISVFFDKYGIILHKKLPIFIENSDFYIKNLD